MSPVQMKEMMMLQLIRGPKDSMSQGRRKRPVVCKMMARMMVV